MKLELKYTDYFIVFQEVPNEVSLAINLSNCPNNCLGCHTPELKNDIGKLLTFNELEKIISYYKNDITCICFMGGDRFPEKINELCLFVKTKLNLKTAWYSGKDTISDKINLDNFDYIKIGHYDKKRGSLKEKTTNQIMYAIKNKKLNNITNCFWKHNNAL